MKALEDRNDRRPWPEMAVYGAVLHADLSPPPPSLEGSVREAFELELDRLLSEPCRPGDPKAPAGTRSAAAREVAPLDARLVGGVLDVVELDAFDDPAPRRRRWTRMQVLVGTTEFGTGVRAALVAALAITLLAVLWPAADHSDEVAVDATSGRAVPNEIPVEDSDAATPVTMAPSGHAVDRLLADPDINVVAESVVGSLAVRSAPAGEVARTLAHPTENGSPLVLLVRSRSDDGRWLLVDLPVRPNGSTGWVSIADVDLRSHTFRIEVSVGEREFGLFRNGDQIMHSPVAVGAVDTPTPGGSFYIKELLEPPNPNTVYGPYAFGLSGFSNALENFAGGEGVIGIHGTDDPDAIGNEVSNGCIRLSNEEITRLVGLLPLGTPVDIVA